MITVRPATLDDWTTIAIFVEESNIEQRLFGVPDFTRAHLEAIHAAITHDLGGVYLAFDGEKPVGLTAMLSFPAMPVGYVEGITTYVHPSYRRTKVAHELGVAAREFHRAQGKTEFRGSVYLTNKASIRRCLAEGAEIVGLLLRYSLDEQERAALPPQDEEKVLADASAA